MAGGIQLHGLVAKGAALPTESPSHQIVAFKTFDALISPYSLPSDTADMSTDDLSTAAMRHHHILLGYCSKNALLPMRFGTVFSTPAALGRAMRENGTQYEAALAMLTDLREYSVHVNVTNAPTKEPSVARDGRAFLSRKQHNRNARRDMAHNRQRFGQSFESDIAALCAQPLVHAAPKPDHVLDVTTLFSTPAVETLRHLASRAQDQASDLGLSITLKGPWPAYHFDPATLGEERLCHDA